MKPRRNVLMAMVMIVILCSMGRPSNAELGFVAQADRIEITDGQSVIGSFVFIDPQVYRPYVMALKTPGGMAVTRNHPPIPGTDADDHATMHPGMWFAFGDINKKDFWRNQAKMVFIDWAVAPRVADDRVMFTVRFGLVDATDQTLGQLMLSISVAKRPLGYLWIWDGVFSSETQELRFGDQEEMGLGVRLATPLIEKNGGRLINDEGMKTAKGTWGKQALWSDYSGAWKGNEVGILLMPSPKNFRKSWFHNRDYGLMVANAFGAQAFTKGDPSEVIVRRGETFRLIYGVLVHETTLDQKVSLEDEYQFFIKAYP
ncbi:MAG: hypothetical protein FJ308_09670 [Planctomycetes bacterium]|nr:hypothetical protein [Planctomycetota bacterium]